MLAEIAGISSGNLSEILHRKRGVSPGHAHLLHTASVRLGREVPWNEWIQNRTSQHKAFFGKVKPLAVGR